MSAENFIICVICDKEEPDVNKVLECLHCHKCYHYRCKKLVGSAARKMRSQQFYCTVECNEMGMRTQHAVASENALIQELRNVIKEVHAMRDEAAASRRFLEDSIKEVEKSQDFLCTKFDEVVSELKQLKIDYSKMEKEMFSVREDYSQLSDAVVTLEAEVDRFKRAELVRNVIVLGVPITREDNASAIVNGIARVMGYALDEKIIEAYRLKASKTDGNYAPIRVVFADSNVKEEFFAKKKIFGQMKVSALGGSFAALTGKITLRDEMTSYGLAMLREVRAMQEQLKAKYVWPGRDGVILMKRTDTSKVEYIRNRMDIRALECSTSKRARGLSVSPEGPPAKR